MKIYKNRVEPTLKYAYGDILEIGCVGMGVNDVVGGEDFIHEALIERANSVTGLDIDKNGVDELNTKGFDVVCQDAQEPYDLGKDFDVIIAEENIEHISNLKTYLGNVYKHLRPDGSFIVTTPNAQCFDFFFQTLVFGKPRVNKFHTHYHSVDTLVYLLESNGFSVDKVMVYQAINPSTTNFLGKIAWLFLRLLPNCFGRTIMVIAKKKEGGGIENETKQRE